MLERKLNDDRFNITSEIDRAIEERDEEFFENIFKELPRKFNLQELHDAVIRLWGHVAGDQPGRILEYYRFKDMVYSQDNSYTKKR